MQIKGNVRRKARIADGAPSALIGWSAARAENGARKGIGLRLNIQALNGDTEGPEMVVEMAKRFEEGSVLVYEVSGVKKTRKVMENAWMRVSTMIASRKPSADWERWPLRIGEPHVKSKEVRV